MPSTKDIKRRIKGVKSTGKITRAMEMISAVKMRRAVESTVVLRPYAQSAQYILEHITAAGRLIEHPLLIERSIRRVLIVVMTSNRGLCGAFNTQVSRQVRRELESRGEMEQIDFLSIGKKGDALLRRLGQTIIASFPEVVQEPTFEHLRPVATIILEAYAQAKYDQVLLISTDYVSALVQRPRAQVLLPIVTPLDSLDSTSEYTIEPEPEVVLEALIPRLIEIELYHALLESNASQEAARMVAMRNASDAAKEMTEDLTLSYNQLRQAKVTQEIAELSAGMAAVGG